MKQTYGKAPKVRYQPGQFVRDKSGNLYCITLIFRTKSDPHVWLHQLEERKSIIAPATQMSEMVERVAGRYDAYKILFDPVRDYLEAYQNQGNVYRHGSSMVENTKAMLNNYIVVSDGDILLEARK